MIEVSENKDRKVSRTFLDDITNNYPGSENIITYTEPLSKGSSYNYIELSGSDTATFEFNFHAFKDSDNNKEDILRKITLLRKMVNDFCDDVERVAENIPAEEEE